ncbi:Homogentisate phytyltransferase 2 [Morus notabilis]|uniref:Homogentisate phytyltransferase 2 n=1 Tax=Morus notabilis TaxID=981085 RepID=W9QR28_9ROSA|nr:Homogentisate phytyltransferase 2 [Morus notabilis]
MKLQISCSSLSVPAIIPRHYNRLIPINPTIKNTKSYNFSSKCSTNKSILPVQLYGERGFSKFLIHGKDKRNSIRGCAQDEFADSHPVLAEVKDKSDGRHILAKVLRFGSSWFSFTRPISMYQLGLAAICLYGRGFVENPHLFKWSLLVKAFPGLIAVLLANANFMGINQIYDADIDRVNKPDLPIPSGELSIRQAWFLAVFEALAGLLILRLMNANLITTALYCFGLFLGAAYSVPPIRFKRHSATTSVGLGMDMCRDVKRAVPGRHGPSNPRPMAGLGRARAGPEEKPSSPALTLGPSP